MRPLVALATSLALLVGACAAPGPAPKPVLPPRGATPEPDRHLARVAAVLAVDTILVEYAGYQRTVRYLGLDVTLPPDAPPRLAEEALAFHRRLVDGRVVELERGTAPDDSELRRWVWLGDQLVNAELVRLGYAAAALSADETRHREALQAAEREARAARRGRWASSATPTPVPSSTPTPAPTVPTATPMPALPTRAAPTPTATPTPRPPAPTATTAPASLPAPSPAEEQPLATPAPPPAPQPPPATPTRAPAAPTPTPAPRPAAPTATTAPQPTATRPPQPTAPPAATPTRPPAPPQPTQTSP